MNYILRLTPDLSSQPPALVPDCGQTKLTTCAQKNCVITWNLTGQLREVENSIPESRQNGRLLSTSIPVSRTDSHSSFLQSGRSSIYAQFITGWNTPYKLIQDRPRMYGDTFGFAPPSGSKLNLFCLVGFFVCFCFVFAF